MQSKGLKSENVLQEPPDESIEAYLRTAQTPRLFLDMRSAKPGDPSTAWLLDKRPMRGIGSMAMQEQFSPCIAKDLYDVLVYIEETTAAKQLETPPK